VELITSLPNHHDHDYHQGSNFFRVESCVKDPESYAGGSVATGRADLGRNVLDLLYLRQIWRQLRQQPRHQTGLWKTENPQN